MFRQSQQAEFDAVKTAIEDRRNVLRGSAQSVNGSSASANDIVSQLERLGSLKERGLLTDQEFAEQEAKLLG